MEDGKDMIKLALLFQQQHHERLSHSAVSSSNRMSKDFLLLLGFVLLGFFLNDGEQSLFVNNNQCFHSKGAFVQRAKPLL